MARGVARLYDDLVALQPMDIDVSPGELVALVGPNGAGKTTLLAMAAGLLEPTSGAIHIEGAPAGSLAARAAVSYIPDTPALYDDLSLDEHLEYVARLHDTDDWQARGPELLERLGLDDRSADLPSQFSRGMRQKTSIALGFIRPFSCSSPTSRSTASPPEQEGAGRATSGGIRRRGRGHPLDPSGRGRDFAIAASPSTTAA